MIIKNNEWPPEHVMVLLDAYSPLIRQSQPPICYGLTLYNPSGERLTEAQVQHEQVHSMRQMAYKGGPDRYVKHYLNNRYFREEEEAMAYAAEIKCRMAGGTPRAMLLLEYSRKMASPLYAGMTTVEAAHRLLDRLV